MRNIELATIVTLAQSDKEQHFEKLFAATWDSVYYLALGMMGNVYDAEDVAQATFLKVYDKLDSLKDPVAFNAWLKAITVNTAKNELTRRAHTRDAADIDDLDAKDLARVSAATTTDTFSPDAALETGDKNALVLALTQALPVAYREVMLLHYYADLSPEEIATSLKTTPGAIYQRLSRARKKLTSQVRAYERAHDTVLFEGALPVGAALTAALHRITPPPPATVSGECVPTRDNSGEPCQERRTHPTASSTHQVGGPGNSNRHHRQRWRLCPSH